MKKLILIFYCFISCYSSCRSGQCDDPKECEGSDKIAGIKVVLSNTDSVLHVGDTLRFYARVPDTLTARGVPERFDGQPSRYNEIETVFVKSFYKKEETNLAVDLNFGDTTNASSEMVTFKSGSGPKNVRWHLVKYSGNPNLFYVPWKKDTREFECFFVLSTPGLYELTVTSSFFGITTQNNKNKMLVPIFNYFDKTGNHINRRYGQYLKYVDPMFREKIRKRLDRRSGWYCFEVKP